MINYKNNIGRAVGHLNHQFLRKLDEELQKENIPLTADQFRLMTVLWDRDGLSQQALALRIGRNRASTGKMIDVLEKKQIIQRQDHPSDRRLKLIFLTAAGRKLDSKARNCAQNVLDKASAGIPDEELKLVLSHLFSMIKNLK